MLCAKGCLCGWRSPLEAHNRPLESKKMQCLLPYKPHDMTSLIFKQSLDTLLQSAGAWYVELQHPDDTPVSGTTHEACGCHTSVNHISR